ncbi:MAG: abortive infection family protein [Symbiopectobacterium sp.]|uniref:abortive infection family protein n=1 Tax=Symbiopectobacterium sp. TaxID=2952789 RepID=UPI0039E75C80
MLERKYCLRLATILSENWESGDWNSMFAETDCEDVPEDIPSFFSHVAYKNENLSAACQIAIEEVLGRNPDNLNTLWKRCGMEKIIQRNDAELYSEIDYAVSNESQRNVQASPVRNVNDTIQKALADAEILLKETGPDSAYDGIHTALYGSLKQICDNHVIRYNSTCDSVDGLLPLIMSYYKGNNTDKRNDTVFKMLRSANSILKGINELRNHNSLAHANSSLLNEADARLAINLARSIMTCVDDLM